MSIKGDYSVVKSNILNELRGTKLSENEYKLFCIYLSRINPKNPDTSKVKFSLEDYGKIMMIKRPRREELEKHALNLVCKGVTIDNKEDGFCTYSLFISFELSNEDGGWVITLDGNPGLSPYLFKFRNKFFKYKLYNAIYLDSYNQIRMYEILKQYEKIGERTIELSTLREFLGLEDNKYSAWNDFREKLLKVSKRALDKKTDITFDFEPIKKVVNGRLRVTAVKFYIKKNKTYVDHLQIEEFIDYDNFEISSDELMADDSFVKHHENLAKNDLLSFYAEACDDEFDESQIKVLYDLIIRIPPYGDTSTADTDRFDYLHRKYNEMVMRKPSHNRFGYLKKLINTDFKTSYD